MLTKRRLLLATLALGLLTVLSLPVMAIGEREEDIPPATIVNDEGGPVVISGEVTYTNAFFTLGLSEPVIILEDQTGFVTRDRGYLFPYESQVLAQITSDVFTSPFNYTLSLPFEPQAPLNDVDFDGEQDTGVMIFQIAYWTNTFGDVYLEERDQFGGGWSGAYASAATDNDPDRLGEYIGGNLLIYAPEDGQAFPSGFGEDGRLFTSDDPLVTIPAGYTIVNMDTEVFTFDRSREATVNLIEGEGAEADDFSDQSYVDAFDSMIEKFRKEYAYTEYYGLDWDALAQEWRPRVAELEDGDVAGLSRVLRDFLYNVPDGHVGIGLNQTLFDDFVTRTDGGLGIAIRQLDDGRVIANFLLEGSPAAEAGMELGAEITSMQGMPIMEWVSQARPESVHPANHVLDLQQLRYATRFPLGTVVDFSFINPGSDEEISASVEVVTERESFAFSSFNQGVSPTRLPVEFELLPSGYMYVEINSFSDDERLTALLWERMIQETQDNQALGIIIDMRNNGGGSGFLADQMAAYFFNEPYELGNTGVYNDDIDDFFFNPDNVDRFFLPPEEQRYDGPVAVIVGPACFSACEFFSWDMTVEDRAAIVGQYPTGGYGGSVQAFFMPEGINITLTVGRALDPEGNIHIEGIGVQPTVRVPVTEETLFAEGDVLLEAAVEHLNEVVAGAESDGG